MEKKYVYAAVGIAGAVGIYFLVKNSQAANKTLVPQPVLPPAPVKSDVIATPAGPAATKDSYDITKAVTFIMDTTGRTLTVKPGQQIHFTKTVGGPAWADPGVVSSNPSVVMPVDKTIADFVAKVEGASVITGYYFADDGSGLAKLTATIYVSAA
jgi:hypothetical protein